MKVSLRFPSGLELEIEDDGNLEPYKMALVSKEPEKVTKQLRRSHTDPAPILSLGEHPANFIVAPIGPKELEPPEPGKNKYGRWEGDVPPEVDAEIVRLRNKGLTTRLISTELACQGITVDYKWIRGRLSAMGREQNKKKSENTAVRSPAPMNVYEGSDAVQTGDIVQIDDVQIDDFAARRRTASEETVLDARILEMYSRLTLKEISAQLEKEGIDLTPKEVSQKVRGIQLREIGAKAGQTVEQRVPEQVNVAESIPAPENVAERSSAPEEVAERTECTECIESIECAPEPSPEKFVTPAKINGEIWDLTKAGLTPKDISEHLILKGLQWTEGMVEKRLERIKAGVA